MQFQDLRDHVDPALSLNGKKYYSVSPCLWTETTAPFLEAAPLMSIEEQTLCVNMLTASMRAEFTESLHYVLPSANIKSLLPAEKNFHFSRHLSHTLSKCFSHSPFLKMRICQSVTSAQDLKPPTPLLQKCFGANQQKQEQVLMAICYSPS